MGGYCIIGIVKKIQKEQNFNMNNSCFEEYWHMIVSSEHSAPFNQWVWVCVFSLVAAQGRTHLVRLCWFDL